MKKSSWPVEPITNRATRPPLAARHHQNTVGRVVSDEIGFDTDIFSRPDLDAGIVALDAAMGYGHITGTHLDAGGADDAIRIITVLRTRDSKVLNAGSRGQHDDDRSPALSPDNGTILAMEKHWLIQAQILDVATGCDADFLPRTGITKGSGYGAIGRRRPHTQQSLHRV